MKINSLLIGLVILVMGFPLAIANAEPVSNPETCILENFSNIERTALLSSKQLLLDAQDGTINLPLLPCMLEIQVLEVRAVENLSYDDGNQTTPAYDLLGKYSHIIGIVPAANHARVFLTLMPEGVNGILHFQSLSINLEVPALSDPEAQQQVSSIELLPAQPTPLMPSSAAAASTRKARFDVDSNLNGQSGGRSHAVSVLGQALYEINLRTSFDIHNWGIRYCTTPSCDDTTLGIDSINDSDDLLTGYGTKMKGRHDNGETWELAGLFIGKDMTGAHGIANTPGRYSVFEMRDEGQYDGRTSTHEAAIAVAHELMHNFKATHEFSPYRTETVNKDVCDINVPVLDICLMSHREYDHTKYYYRLMYASAAHEPSNQKYQDFSMSTSTLNAVNNCESGNWGNIDYVVTGSKSC